MREEACSPASQTNAPLAARRSRSFLSSGKPVWISYAGMVSGFKEEERVGVGCCSLRAALPGLRFRWPRARRRRTCGRETVDRWMRASSLSCCIANELDMLVGLPCQCCFVGRPVCFT